MAKRYETGTVTTTLRIPRWLWKQLESEAKKKDVSLNSEMVNRLNSTFRTDERWQNMSKRLDRNEQLLKLLQEDNSRALEEIARHRDQLQKLLNELQKISGQKKENT
jgi:DNA phosphorothioation-dependent restriction protein DptG